MLDLAAAARYGLTPETLGDAEALAAADAQAAATGDTAFLLARIAALHKEAEVAWLDPRARPTPAEALQRIKAICAFFPDLYGAMTVAQATHPSVAREILALALKQFRRDTDALSAEDVQGLLTSIANGGQQAFEAVLRTRKGGERKASALPWGRDGD